MTSQVWKEVCTPSKDCQRRKGEDPRSQEKTERKGLCLSSGLDGQREGRKATRLSKRSANAQKTSVDTSWLEASNRTSLTPGKGEGEGRASGGTFC